MVHVLALTSQCSCCIEPAAAHEVAHEINPLSAKGFGEIVYSEFPVLADTFFSVVRAVALRAGLQAGIIILVTRELIRNAHS